MSQLVVKNLNKEFGEGDSLVHALSDVNLSVKTGEFLAIMGASGSGKTTLLNCISTIDKPTSGDISFEGFDIINATDNQLANYRSQNISYIFQSYNLVETLTVYENIVLPLQIQGKKVADCHLKIENILEKLSIGQLRNKFPNQLSGGQRQRVATARALIDESKLLIADEPTGNLDPQTSRDISDLFKAINNSGTTVVMVTHDMDMVSYLNKRVIALEGGRVVSDQMRGAAFHEN